MKPIEKLKYIMLIALIYIAACVETDIYLPSFPDMMQHFNVGEVTIQKLLTWNFIGICLSGPFYGPLSDSYGRKKLLMFALLLFFIGSIGTVYSTNINTIIMCRIMQGLASGGCFTLGATIIYDVFHEQEATKVVNNLNCIVPIIVSLAPMLGSYINLHYGFRANFLVITILVFVSFLVCLFMLDETLPETKRVPFQLDEIKNNFATVMKSVRFWAPAIIVSAIFAGYLTYISYSVILFVNGLGVSSKVYPYYQASVLIAFVIANLSANKVITIYGVDHLKRMGSIFLLLGGTGFVVCVFWHPTYYNLFHVFMLLYSFGAGWTFGPYFTDCMEPFPDIKGVVASLATSARLLSAAFVISIASYLYNGTAIPLAIILICLFTIGIIAYVVWKKAVSIESTLCVSGSANVTVKRIDTS